MKHSLSPQILCYLALLLLSVKPLLGAGTPDSLVLCDDVADPVTLNPHRAWENKSYNIMTQIFDGLLRFDDEGNIQPSLATKCLQTSSTTLQCRLRQNVQFHNGETFDAESVRWSILHQIDPATGYPGRMELASIKEVRVIEPYLIEIKTHQPDGLLMHRLAIFVHILPHRYLNEVGQERFEASPIGTGPYKFLSWEKGKAIHLTANENYWEKDLPKIKKITFQFLPQETQLPQLLDGQLDLVTEIPATNTRLVAQNAKTKIVKRLVLTTPAFWFTSFNGPLAHQQVRQALNLAIDKESLVRYATLGNGRAIATLSMQGEWGHNENLTPYPYSPKKSKALLTQAGYPDGFSITLLTADQASREASILAAQWKKIGVHTTVTALPLNDVHLTMVHKKQEFDISANLAPNPTAHIYFLPGVCFYSQSLFSRLKSPEFDQLYEKLIHTTDPVEQLRYAKELDTWIYDQALGVFTYQKIRTYALKRDLEISIPVSGMLNLKNFYWKSQDGG